MGFRTIKDFAEQWNAGSSEEHKEAFREWLKEPIDPPEDMPEIRHNFFYGVKKFFDFIFWPVDKFTHIFGQRTDLYDFTYDVSQKVVFFLVVVFMLLIPPNEYYYAAFIPCCILGRFLMAAIQVWLDKQEFNKSRTSGMRFLHLSDKAWKRIVLAFLIFVSIRTFKYCMVGGMNDGMTVICMTIMNFIAFFVFGGITHVVNLPPDPNRVGTLEWMQANDVHQISGASGDRIFRTKDGQYYRHNVGEGWYPIPPTVTHRNKP